MSKGTESHTSRSTEICLEGINAPWGEVLHLAVRSSYPKGHKTLGSCLQGFYYIASGRVRLSYLNEDGEEYGKLILGEGCLFNETPALAGTSWYTVFFCCLDAAEIWRFDASLLEDEAFLASHPHLAINLMRSIARKASIFFFHLARTHSTTSMCRLCDLLLQLSNPHQPDLCMSQSDVAAMMGLHQTTVARLIRRLREEGIIDRFTKWELQVLDRERLRRLAQHGDLKA